MATAAQSSGNSGVDVVSGLLNLIKGNGSNTTTTQSNISQTGINSILQQILGGTSGLAAVSSGQKNAGVYNSSTNQLLTNDLLTRAAGQVAQLSAGTTTKTKGNSITGNNLLDLIVAGGASKLLGPSVSGAASKLGINTVGKKLADSLGLGDGAGTGGIPGVVGTAGAGGSDPLGLFSGFNGFGGGGINDALASYGSDVAGIPADVSNAFDVPAAGLATSSAGDVADDVGTSLASTVGDDASDSLGSFLGGLFG